MEPDKFCLVLSNGIDWNVTLTPSALEAGLPVTVIFSASICFDHPTGQFTYTANDLTFMPKVFEVFSDDLGKLLKGELERCVLSAIGDKLQLALRRFNRTKVLLEIRIHEFQPDAEAAEMVLPAALSDYDSLERLHRRVSEFSRNFVDWIEEQSVIGPNSL